MQPSTIYKRSKNERPLEVWGRKAKVFEVWWCHAINNTRNSPTFSFHRINTIFFFSALRPRKKFLNIRKLNNLITASVLVNDRWVHDIQWPAVSKRLVHSVGHFSFFRSLLTNWYLSAISERQKKLRVGKKSFAGYYIIAKERIFFKLFSIISCFHTYFSP